jgi:hypothetical protein
MMVKNKRMRFSRQKKKSDSGSLVVYVDVWNMEKSKCDGAVRDSGASNAVRAGRAF